MGRTVMRLRGSTPFRVRARFSPVLPGFTAGVRCSQGDLGTRCGLWGCGKHRGELCLLFFPHPDYLPHLAHDVNKAPFSL